MCTGTSAFTVCTGSHCGGTCENNDSLDPPICNGCYNNCDSGCTTAICTLIGSSCVDYNCHNNCYEASCIDLCYKLCASWVENKTGIACASSCSATGRNIFYYVVLNISLKLLGVIIWVEKEKFLKNQKV